MKVGDRRVKLVERTAPPSRASTACRDILRRGHIVLPSAFEIEALRTLRATADAFCIGRERSGQALASDDVWRAAEIALGDGAVSEVIDHLTNGDRRYRKPRVLRWSDVDGARTRWHQDAQDKSAPPYAFTVWIPLVQDGVVCSRDTVGLQWVSERVRKRYARFIEGRHQQMFDWESAELDLGEDLYMVERPRAGFGDVLIFDNLTAHASHHPKAMTSKRLSLDIRFTSGDGERTLQAIAADYPDLRDPAVWGSAPDQAERYSLYPESP